jgi:hypothetical protein
LTFETVMVVLVPVKGEINGAAHPEHPQGRF